jgi:hypothetical protein
MTIAEGSRVGMGMLGEARDLLSAVSTFIIRMAIRESEKRAGEEGYAYGDDERAKLLRAFAEHSPLGFIVALPEIIEDNPAGFSDEDKMESCVADALSKIPGGQFGQLENAMTARLYASGEDFLEHWKIHQ